MIRNLSLSLLFLVLLSTTVNAQQIEKWKLKDLKNAIANADKPTILNFWATFCKPCLEEMPYFEKIAEKYKKEGLELILVSLDAKDQYPTKLRTFLKKRKIKSRVVFLDETNADLFCPAVDSSWSGAIPASLFVNNKTGYRYFVEAELKPAALDVEAGKLME